MKKIIQLSLLSLSVLVPLVAVHAAQLPLVARFQGQILLQVQSHGEAWYVNPKDQKRYYMKDGATAYQMMRHFGQGISEADFTKAQAGDSKLLRNIKGLIVLRVGLHGEAYYIHPKTLALYYLKDGSAAYALMRGQGSGIADADLGKIPTGEIGASDSSSPKLVSLPSPTVVTPSGVYCTSESDNCAGFKAKIDFDENPNTCGYNCRYTNTVANTKEVYYLVVRGDTVSGKVVLQNLNSGTERDYQDITSGTYDSATGAIDFTYGYYLYPTLEVDFKYIEHKGTIAGNQFTGTRKYTDSNPSPTTGKITTLPITSIDEIPRNGCTIKGDALFYSGGQPTYYLPTSTSYSKIHIVHSWFCSEQDAIIAGYQKALR